MFEGSIPQVDSHESLENGGLRLIDWSTLVARFDAAREFRRSTGPARTPSVGSFSALSKMAAAENSSILNKTTVGVNPTILGHRKAVTAKMLASAVDVQTPSRELI